MTHARWALLLLIVVGYLVPWFGYDPIADVHVHQAALPPSWTAWLGTDHLGRDVAWRLLLAIHGFAWPGSLSALLAVSLGVLSGACAGFWGGYIEHFIRYLLRVFSSVSTVVWVVLFLSAWGNHPFYLAIAVGLGGVPAVGESIYGRILSLRKVEFLEASRAHGISEWRLLWVHLIFYACGSVIVANIFRQFAIFLTMEVTLSYLGGFGVREPMPSWGNMLMFDWGYDIHPVARWSPAIAILGTLVLAYRAAEIRS